MSHLRRPLGRECRPTTRRCLLALIALAVPLAHSPVRAEQRPPQFRVIVNRDNREKSVAREFLADAFLKRATRWGDGQTIQPVDQKPDTEARRRFSKIVLRKSVAAVRNYWQQRIFSGRGVPPPELDSDAAVVDYVRKHRGSVGYVTGTAKIDGVDEIAVD
jgi:ABC-type phosphate transport system substrate-binding protein